MLESSGLWQEKRKKWNFYFCERKKERKGNWKRKQRNLEKKNENFWKKVLKNKKERAIQWKENRDREKKREIKMKVLNAIMKHWKQSICKVEHPSNPTTWISYFKSISIVFNLGVF